MNKFLISLVILATIAVVYSSTADKLSASSSSNLQASNNMLNANRQQMKAAPQTDRLQAKNTANVNLKSAQSKLKSNSLKGGYGNSYDYDYGYGYDSYGYDSYCDPYDSYCNSYSYESYCDPYDPYCNSYGSGYGAYSYYKRR